MATDYHGLLLHAWPRAFAFGPYLEIRSYEGLVTLKEIFEGQAKRVPRNVALEDATGKRSLSYAELDSLADSLAGLLRTRYGIGPGSRVCLAAERTVEAMISLLAILKAGGTYVPLGLRLPDARLRTMIDDVLPSVVLCGEGSVDRFSTLGMDLLFVVRVDDLTRTRESPPIHMPQTEASVPGKDELAYIIFTSGTTGKPKGVMVPNSAMARYIDAMRQLLNPGPDERVIQIMELTFDSSVFDIWMTWAFGGTAVLCDKWAALEGLGDFISKRNITYLGCTPTQLSVLTPDEVPTLRVVAIGGEAVPPPLIQTWVQHPCCRIYNQYGPTEAARDLDPMYFRDAIAQVNRVCESR